MVLMKKSDYDKDYDVDDGVIVVVDIDDNYWVCDDYDDDSLICVSEIDCRALFLSLNITPIRVFLLL